MRGALGGLDAERRIAACATPAWQLVAALLRLGQGEETVEAVQALVDDAFVDAVVLDDDETVLLVGRGQVVREPRVFGGTRVEGGYGVCHLRAIVPTTSGM